MEEKRNVGLGLHFLVKQQVSLRVAAVGIARGILQPQFLDDAGLAGSGLSAMGVGSDDVHTNLARRIASKNRAILHEDDTRSIAGSRNRAGHAASDHNKIHRET
jgi:hypothetical protein